MKLIAKGLSCSSKREVTGVLKYISSLEDVISLFDDAVGKICIVNDAGTTTLSPIISELTATICTTGAAGSHLAIVSREFEISCVMAAEFQEDSLAKLNNKHAKITTDENGIGHLYILD